MHFHDRCGLRVLGPSGEWVRCPRAARFTLRRAGKEVRLCWPCMTRRLQTTPARNIRILPAEA